jgi:hypothetical protein
VSSLGELGNTPVSTAFAANGPPVPGLLSDAVHHWHDAQRALADGRDHGGRRGLGEFHSAGHLRARAAAQRPERIPGRPRRRPYKDPPGADDGSGDGRRHAPEAIGGPGEEQNAALARAVIGGLLFATPTTLLIVPYLFAVLRKSNDGVAAYGVFEDLPDE